MVQLAEITKGCTTEAIAFCIEKDWLTPEQGLANLHPTKIQRILNNPAGFLEAIKPPAPDAAPAS